MVSLAGLGSKIKSVFKSKTYASEVKLDKKPESFEDAVKLFVELHNEDKYEFGAILDATFNHLIQKELDKELATEKDARQAAENVFERLSPELSDKLIKAFEQFGSDKTTLKKGPLNWKHFVSSSIASRLSYELGEMARPLVPDAPPRPYIGVWKNYIPTSQENNTAELN